jgi:hypothetical protein
MFPKQAAMRLLEWGDMRELEYFTYLVEAFPWGDAGRLVEIGIGLTQERQASMRNLESSSFFIKLIEGPVPYSPGEASALVRGVA